MTTRARKEEWISTYRAGDFDDALTRVMMRYPGLSFFTDEQMEEIVAEMARKARFHQSFRVQQRRALRRVA